MELEKLLSELEVLPQYPNSRLFEQRVLRGIHFLFCEAPAWLDKITQPVDIDGTGPLELAFSRKKGLLELLLPFDIDDPVDYGFSPDALAREGGEAFKDSIVATNAIWNTAISWLRKNTLSAPVFSLELTAYNKAHPLLDSTP